MAKRTPAISPRDRYLRRVYGITEEQYQEVFIKQGGRCAICKHPPKGKRNLDVDHSHGPDTDYVPTGAIRGLLCWSCNRRLVADHIDPTLFANAAKYLKQHTGYIVPKEYLRGVPRKRRKRKKKG